jgi:hypothetical protein
VTVAAHLILGAEPEPALSALLASIEPFSDSLIVNENSGQTESENLAVLHASAFARTGRLVLDRTPFVDFAHARNRCLALHAEIDAAPWVAFVDADEVHTPRGAVIAANLSRLPASITVVDGYTRHFFQSPDWYLSVERRMSFFRFSPRLHWEGAVHEQLKGLGGARLCLPYVYAHYGHLATTYRHAVKERLYHLLGRGALIDDAQLASLDPERYFAARWPLLHHFSGRHPAAAEAFIAEQRQVHAERFAASERFIERAGQAWRGRAMRVFWRANYAARWRSRALHSLALRVMTKL